MTSKRKFEIADMRQAIAEVGSSPAAIAARLGCTRSTVYKYLRKFPELKTAFETTKGEPIQTRGQFTKAQFEEAISKSHGVKASVAAAVGCSRQTVDNWLDQHEDLREKLEAARSELVGKAVGALVKDIDTPESDGHQRAYMFALRTLGKDEGFTERQEVTGADGENLFGLSPEALRLVERMGMDMRQVARHFEGMVKAAAAQRGLVGAGE